MKWALKILIKIALARLPIPYKCWRSLDLFRHGYMDSADYMVKIFKIHSNRAYPKGFPPGLVILELGPGDSVGSGLVAAGLGAASTYLVDVGVYARQNVNFYQKVAAGMRSSGVEVPSLSSAVTFDDVLRICNMKYLTSGLDSLKQIPTGSIDFVWSHSVLEHVRKNEISAVLMEIKRILKPGGFSSHNIDFQDHIGGALNNLRFSEKVWESKLFTKSGFYTNRIPAVRMHSIFREAGFKVLKEAFGQWPELPVRRQSIHPEFGEYVDDELRIRTSHVLLQA